MTKIVKAHDPKPVIRQKLRKIIGQVVGIDPITHRVSVDILALCLIIALSAQFAVEFLYIFFFDELGTEDRDQRQRSMTSL